MLSSFRDKKTAVSTLKHTCSPAPTYRQNTDKMQTLRSLKIHCSTGVGRRVPIQAFERQLLYLHGKISSLQSLFPASHFSLRTTLRVVQESLKPKTSAPVLKLAQGRAALWGQYSGDRRLRRAAGPIAVTDEPQDICTERATVWSPEKL